jgi:hypothetical protein
LKTKTGIVQSERARRIKGSAVDIDKLLLKGERFRTHVEDNILGATMTRTTEAASSINIQLHDPHRDLLQSKMFNSKFDMEIDGLWFTYVGISKSSSVLELTFEDREANFMRRYKGPKKAYRDKMTRAEFVYGLVREVKEKKIKVHIPELFVEQPIAPASGAVPLLGKGDADSQEEGKRGDKGIDRSANLTIKGVPANPTQLDNCEECLGQGQSMGASSKVLIGSIACGIVESTCLSVPAGQGDLDSVGFFQQRPSMGWPATGDVSTDAEAFFKKAIAYDNANPGASIGALVFAVQIGASVGTYQASVPEAEKIVDAWGGGSLSGASGQSVKTSKYAFEQGKEETNWDCAGRLAEEVQWRRFMSNGVFYYASELNLFYADPYMFIRGDEEGILDVDFDHDDNIRTSEVRIRANIKEWGAPPGTVCKVGDEFGPAEGRYLVTTIESDFFSPEATITASRPLVPLPEPAPETTVISGRGGSNTGGGSSTGDIGDIDFSKGGWGGTEAVFLGFIDGFMRDKGFTIGGRKEQGHQAGGDHDPASTTSFACDYGTMNGEAAARELAEILGLNCWKPNSYNIGCGTVSISGRRFRVQILWGAAIDHADHVHVGLRAA